MAIWGPQMTLKMRKKSTKIGPGGSLGPPWAPWGRVAAPLGCPNHDDKYFFSENVAPLVNSLGRPNGPGKLLGAIFVEQRFGSSPPKAQGVNGLGPQDGRLFNPSATTKSRSFILAGEC